MAIIVVKMYVNSIKVFAFNHYPTNVVMHSNLSSELTA